VGARITVPCRQTRGADGRLSKISERRKVAIARVNVLQRGYRGRRWRRKVGGRAKVSHITARLGRR
jgi:hypothetical protein